MTSGIESSHRAEREAQARRVNQALAADAARTAPPAQPAQLELIHDEMPCDFGGQCQTMTHYVCEGNRYGESHHLTPRSNGAQACQYCDTTESAFAQMMQEARA